MCKENNGNVSLYIVCVLYNSRIEDIASLEVFLSFAGKYDHVRLIIMDNSAEEYTSLNIEAYTNKYKDSLIYVNNGGNIGISKAYNKALDMIKDEVFHVMFSDDDTIFSEEYIENVVKAVKAGKTDIISGIISTERMILSPAARIAGGQQHYILEPGIYRNIYCVNTGLTVKSTVYDIVGKYDEHQFLDAVDLLFADKLIDCGINNIEIVPGKITQNFSMESDDIAARKKRISIMTRDWKYWWKAEHRHTWFIFWHIFSANYSLLKMRLLKSMGK